MFFNNSFISIDIGSYSIKVAEFSGLFQKSVVSLGAKILPLGAVVEGAIANRESVEFCLNQILSEMRIRRLFRRANMALSGSNVMVKRISMVRNENVDINEQIFYEAEKNLQMDMNELYFDFVFEKSEAESIQKIALIAASKRDTVGERVEIIEKMGLKAGIIDVECYALTNLLEYSYGIIEGLFCLVNIGARSTNVIFISNGKYLYSKEIGIGGENYTRAIGEASSVSDQEAENIKMRISADEYDLNESIISAINMTHELLISEFQLSVDFFHQSGEAPSDKVIKGIFLTGGGSLMTGVVENFKAKFDIPVELLDPFVRMKVPRRFRGSQFLPYRSMFAVSAGLSLRKLQEEREL